MSNEYRIVLKFSEDEFLALARLGYKELRSVRSQARYIVRNHLIQSGILQDSNVFNPAPEPTPETTTDKRG